MSKIKVKIKEAISVIENFLKIYEEYLTCAEEDIEFTKVGLERNKILAMHYSLRTLKDYEYRLVNNYSLPMLEISNLYQDFEKWLKAIEEICDNNIMGIPLKFKEHLFTQSYSEIYTTDEKSY